MKLTANEQKTVKQAIYYALNQSLTTYSEEEKAQLKQFARDTYQSFGYNKQVLIRLVLMDTMVNTNPSLPSYEEKPMKKLYQKIKRKHDKLEKVN